MPNLTSRRSSGVKTGYWSPAKKDDLVQRLGPIEERAEGLIANTCDQCCIYQAVGGGNQAAMDKRCSQCPLCKLHNLIYPR